MDNLIFADLNIFVHSFPGFSAYVFGALVLLTLLILLKFLYRRDHYPYTARDELFTKAEQKFLTVLDKAVGGECRIFGQVRLADVINVRKGLDRKSWGRAFAQIRAKHLCDPQTLAILCAIELDDSTHDRPDRRDRDYFLNHAMQAADVPLHRFPVRKSYRCKRDSAKYLGIGLQPSRSHPFSREVPCHARKAFGRVGDRTPEGRREDGQIYRPGWPRN